MNITDHMAGMASHGMPKTPKAPQMHGGEGEQGDSPKDAIHAHLKAMQEKHGGSHTHIHHKDDGSHESYHASETGEASGPNDHDGAGCGDASHGEGHEEPDSDDLM